MVVGGEEQRDVSLTCVTASRGGVGQGKDGFLAHLTSSPNVFEAFKQISVLPFHSQILMTESRILKNGNY